MKKHFQTLGVFCGLALFVVIACITSPINAEIIKDTMITTTLSPETGLLSFGLLGLMVNRDSIAAVFEAIKTEFNKAFTGGESTWQKTAMEIPSTTGKNIYKWLSRFPKMRRWVGSKHIKSLEAFSYTIENEDWETTIEVDRNDIEDDTLGAYAMQATQAGQSARELPDDIIDELKNDSFTNLCYDGQYYYDTDHPVGDTTVSNKITVALSAATSAAAEASLGVAVNAIMQFKDEEGQPLKVIPRILEVPPALRSIGIKLTTAEKLDDNSVNPFKDSLELVINPGLTSTTAWFVHVTDQAIKPFIYQPRKAPVFVSQTGMESDNVFDRKHYKFGAEARAAGGYGFWQLSHGSTGA